MLEQNKKKNKQTKRVEKNSKGGESPSKVNYSNYEKLTAYLFMRAKENEASVQFFRDSIHAFNDRIQTRENRLLWTV